MSPSTSPFRAFAAASFFALASSQIACRGPSANLPASVQGSSLLSTRDTYRDIRVDDTSFISVGRNGFLTRVCFTSAVRFTDVGVDGVAIEGRGDFMPADTFGVPLPWPLHQSQWGLLYVNSTLSALGVGTTSLYLNYSDAWARNLSFYPLPPLPASPPAGFITSPPFATDMVSNFTVGRPRPVCPPPSGTAGGGVPGELQGRAYVPSLRGISTIDDQGIWTLEGTTLYPNAPFFVANGFCFLNATTLPDWPASNGTMYMVHFGRAEFPVCMFVQRMANGDAYTISKSPNPIDGDCGILNKAGETLDCSCAASPFTAPFYSIFTPTFFNTAAPAPWTPSSTPTATSIPTATQSPIPISTVSPVTLPCPPLDASTVDPNLIRLRLLLPPPNGTTFKDVGSFSLARGFSNATENGQHVTSTCVSKSYWPFGNDSTSLVEIQGTERVDIPTAASSFTTFAQISLCVVLVRTETAVYESTTVLGPFYPGTATQGCFAETPAPPVERTWKKTGDITTASFPTTQCSGTASFDTYLQGRGMVNATFAVIGAASTSYVGRDPFTVIQDSCLLSSKDVGNYTWEVTQGRSDSRTDTDCLWYQRWGYDLYVWNGGSYCPSALASAAVIYATTPNITAVAFYSSPSGQGLVYPTVSPGASPSNSRSASTTRSVSGTPSLTRSVSATPTPTLSNGATPSTSPTFSTTPTLTPSGTPTLSPTASSTASTTATLSTGATPSTTPTQSDGFVPAGAATAAGSDVNVGAAVGGTIGAALLLTAAGFVGCFIRGRSLPHRSPMKKMSASGSRVFELGSSRKKTPTRNSVNSINDRSFRVATVVTANPTMGLSAPPQTATSELPPGWQMCSDETDTWFVDPSGESHWEHPGAGGAPGTFV